MSGPVSELAQFQRVLNSNPIYANRPALAAAVASSGASSQDARTVGGFVEALNTERAVNLASQSGARLTMSGRERSLAGSLGSRYASVQANVPFRPMFDPAQFMPPVAASPRGDAAPGQDGDLNWFESAITWAGDAAGDVAHTLLDNPVTNAIFGAWEWGMNGVKSVYRGISSGVNQDNDAEVRRQMVLRGYDPNSVGDNIAFYWNQGENLYADISDLRDRFGDDKINRAQEYLNDPQGYLQHLQDPNADPADIARMMNEQNTSEWQDMVEQLNARHISPGRDIADGLGLEWNSTGYTAVSGTLDAVATVLMDPTIMAGSAIRSARVTRDGLNSMTDLNGIRRAFGLETDIPSVAEAATRRGNLAAPIVGAVREGAATLTGGRIAGRTPVGEGAQQYLDEAKALRTARADGDVALATQIYTGMAQRHRALMPLLGEVNGARVTETAAQLTNYNLRIATRRETAHADDLSSIDVFAPSRKTGSITSTVEKDVPDSTIRFQSGKGQAVTYNVVHSAPIETLDDFAEYLAGNGALVRTVGGMAAGKQLIMPGRISWAAERRARHAEARVGRAGNTGEVFTYGKDSKSLAPDEVDNYIQTAADAGAKYDADFIHASKLGFRRYRARAERLNRRLTTYLPRSAQLDMTNPLAVVEVRNLARMYLPKREADRIAALWDSGNLAQRRNITYGLVQSTMHAAGLGRSKAGLSYMEKWSADTAEQGKRAYGFDGADMLSSEAGERMTALYDKQLSDFVTIPPFAELQHLASKGAFMGRIRAPFQSEKLDRAMNLIRLGWLVNPATGVRNALDEVASILAKGQISDLTRGRALHTAATKDLRAGRREAKRTAREVERESQIAGVLEKSFAHRIPEKFRTGSDRVNDVLFGSVMGKLLSNPAFRGRPLTEDEVRYAKELNGAELSEFASSVVLSGQAVIDESGRAMGEVFAREGVVARQMKYVGHNLQELDGGRGLNAWAQNLAIRFEANSPARIALQHLVSDEKDLPQAAREIEAFMRTPAGERMLTDAEIVNFDAAGKRITDEGLRDKAIREYAQRVLTDVNGAVRGRNGEFHEGLVERLLRNEPPDRQWLAEHIPEDSRPSHAIMPEYVPLAEQSTAGKVIEGYASMLAKGFEWTVTRPTNAITRNPAFTSHYVRARGRMAQYEKMLTDRGWSEEAAAERAQAIARQHAELMVAKTIDDPSLRSQMTVIIRNFSNFQRAQEDWLRRWGRNLRDDPTILFKSALLLEAGTETGVVDKDEDGNLTFTYPGSGAAVTAISKVFNLFGQNDGVKIPMIDDLSSQLTFLSPSLDNPIGFSASPIFATPFKLMSGLFDENRVFYAAADKLLNGPMGAGQTSFQQIFDGFLPKPVAKIVQLTHDDPWSQMASAQRQAMLLMEAGGLVPDNMNESELAAFKHQLQVTAKNMMIGRALFGTFAPAAPGVPELDVGGQEPDWAFHEAGLTSLQQEYHQLLANVGYEKAQEVWLLTHPHELVYMQASATEADAKGAFAPPTLEAAKWIQSNTGFMSQYKGVSSYFIPQSAGEFSSVGWQAQLETGVRQYKTFDEYVDSIIVRRGESEFYGVKDQFDAAIAEAVASGNVDEQAALEDEWSVQSKLMRDFNPLMAAKMANYGVGQVEAAPNREQLRAALSDPLAVQAMGQENARAVAALIAINDRYNAEKAVTDGNQSAGARAYRSAMRNETRTAMEQVVAQAPEMQDLYNALFRMND